MNSDFLDDAQAHTLAKHQILQEYLKGWLPILGRGQSNRLLYFDGFAGCGELTSGQPGSPLVAIRTAVEAHAGNAPLEVQMVEKDTERCSYLRRIIEQERRDYDLQRIRILEPICGSCEEAVTKLLHDHERTQRPLGPAFFFLDQYGYAGFSMQLVNRILSHPVCETFSYLNWQRMHPYLSDATKSKTLTRALGGHEWREVQNLRGQVRIEKFRSIYIGALRERGGATYVYDFAMRGPNHRLIYWLFFCTNSLKGLEVMKKAMWKVDPTGKFEFSDRDAEQGQLPAYTPSLLANDLDRDLRGRELDSEALKEHVLTRTPEFQFAEAINILKCQGRVKIQRQQGKIVYVFSPPAMRTDGLFC